MSVLVTLDGVSAATPDGRVLFDHLTFALGPQRAGLVGRNGAGKSTLLRIIAGEVEPAAGVVTVSGRIGVLRQSWPDERASLAQALGVEDDLARLRRLEQGEPKGDDLDRADWTLEMRLAETFADIGFAIADLSRSIASLSGGERTRLAIARLMLEAPDLLLLDEPTNNLDADGRALVKRLLEGWRGGALVASHDRDLLEGMDAIVELSTTGAGVFGGGWSAYAAARAERLASAEAAVAKAEGDVRRAGAAVQQRHERKERRDRAGRASRMRGDAPKMFFDFKQDRAEASGARDNRIADRQLADANEALTDARKRVEVLTPLKIETPGVGLPATRQVLALEDVVAEQGGRRLFGPLSFTVVGPERIRIAGRNGAGKTSLLKLISGDLAPASGSIRRLAGRIALLDQHAADLDDASSLFANMQRANPELNDNDAYAALARFAFRNTDALKQAGALSGGERLRAALACLLSAREPPQLLLLDEPTNHLDIASIEVIEAALNAYDGALIVVSHDPAFVASIGCEREIALA